MTGKIFYRERVKSKEGGKTPRFRVVAVCGIDVKFFGNHFRKKELEQIAKAADAELVALERDQNAKM